MTISCFRMFDSFVRVRFGGNKCAETKSVSLKNQNPLDDHSFRYDGPVRTLARTTTDHLLIIHFPRRGPDGWFEVYEGKCCAPATEEVQRFVVRSPTTGRNTTDRTITRCAAESPCSHTGAVDNDLSNSTYRVMSVDAMRNPKLLHSARCERWDPDRIWIASAVAIELSYRFPAAGT